MDLLGAIFLVILIIVMLVTNIIFFRKISKTKSAYFKYKISFFLISIISIAILLIMAALFESLILTDYFEAKIDFGGYTYRTAIMVTVLALNIMINFFLLRSYLKKAYLKENTKTEEIELIGIE